ncbi:MAG: restriction endonuclease subunit S [Eubacteriales bacterium]|nr:restriction endonuclease subunit S [Eubacteriales bacterium]
MWNYTSFENAVEICDKQRKPINNKERLKRIEGKNSKDLFPYYGATGQIGFIDDYITDGEYVLLGEDGAPFLNAFAPKAYIISGKTWVNNHAHVLQSKTNNKFLCYYLNYFNYKGYVSGTTRLKLTQAQMKRIKIPDISIDEQQQIVSRIEELFSELDKGVEILKTIKQQLTVYRQAVLKEAFEGKWLYVHRTSIHDNIKFRKLKSDEENKLAPIPSQWQYVYLSELGDLSRGKSKHRPRNDERLFEDGKYPFFQTGDVKAANKILADCEKKYGEFGLAQSKLWSAGTLCITIAANIAETCFLGVDGCFPDSIVGFTPFENIVNKEYVRYFIEASKKRLWVFAPATAQKNINLTTLENLIIPYCNLDEQNFIVQEIESRLSVCDSIEQTVDTALAQAEAMRQSILKKAFEGGFSE